MDATEEYETGRITPKNGAKDKFTVKFERTGEVLRSKGNQKG